MEDIVYKRERLWLWERHADLHVVVLVKYQREEDTYKVVASSNYFMASKLPPPKKADWYKGTYDLPEEAVAEADKLFEHLSALAVQVIEADKTQS